MVKSLWPQKVGSRSQIYSGRVKFILIFDHPTDFALKKKWKLLWRQALHLSFPRRWSTYIWDLRNERRHSILMTRHYPHQSSASDWSYRVGNLLQPIRNTIQIWVMKRLLRPCLRRNFVGKSVVAPRIVSCFLRGEMFSCVLRRESESFSE